MATQLCHILLVYEVPLKSKLFSENDLTMPFLSITLREILTEEDIHKDAQKVLTVKTHN